MYLFSSVGAFVAALALMFLGGHFSMTAVVWAGFHLWWLSGLLFWAIIAVPSIFLFLGYWFPRIGILGSRIENHLDGQALK